MTEKTPILILEYCERFQSGQKQIAGNPQVGLQKQSLLDQKLAAFDPQKHGGEVMADAPRGEEAFADQTLP